MSRNPSVRRSLAVAVLMTLILVPMAGARTWESPSANRGQESWLGATLHWAEELVGLRHSSGHRPGSSSQQTPQTKADNTTQGAGCLDPVGKPWCGV